MRQEEGSLSETVLKYLKFTHAGYLTMPEALDSNNPDGSGWAGVS